MRASFSQRLTVALVPPLAAALIRLLGSTLRYETIIEPGGFAHYKDSPPGVYCFWHRSLITASHAFRNWKIAIMVSRSRDGELIARVLERLGFLSVRGSSSRGGAAALVAARAAFERGYNAAFAADGPKGPIYVAKPGAAYLAAAVGASYIGAFYLHPHSAWVLRSWDRFYIPKPFSKVTVSFACAVPVERIDDPPREWTARKTAEVTAAIERARAAAERGSW